MKENSLDFYKNMLNDVKDDSEYPELRAQILSIAKKELSDEDYRKLRIYTTSYESNDEDYIEEYDTTNDLDDYRIEGKMLKARELADEYVMSTPGGQYYPYYCLVDLNNSVRNPRLHGYRDRGYDRKDFAKKCGIKDSYPSSMEMTDWVAEIDAIGNPNTVFAIWTPVAMYLTEYGKQNVDKFIEALENSIKYQQSR